MSVIERMGRIGIWTGVFDAHPASAVADAAAELEETGIRALWLPETLGRDPFVLAGVVLGATSSLNVATGIANIWARDPVTMKALGMTLNEAYGDRFLLGMGVSHENLVEWIRKHAYEKPYSKMVEYLAAMHKAKFRGTQPAEELQMVIAALGPKMLALAAEQTDGAHPYLVPPEHTKIARDALGPDSWLAPEQMVIFEEDPAAAKEIARMHLKVYLERPNYANNLVRLGFSTDDVEAGADNVLEAIVAWGGDDAIKARLDAHFAAGADHVCVQTLRADTAIPMEDWRRVAALYQ